MPHEDEEMETEAGDGDGGEEDPPEVEAASPPRYEPKKSKKKNNGLGAAAAAPGPPREPLDREAVLLWPQLLAGKIPREGKTAYDVRIQVFQMDPPAPQGDSIYIGVISGNNVMGTAETPAGVALLEYVTNHFHLPRPAGRSSVKYQLRFIWAQTSANFAKGDLILPGAEEINQIRRADAERRRAQGEVAPPYVPPVFGSPQAPPGFGSPHPPPYPSPPWPSYPPPSDNSPMMLQMMREMWEASMQQRAPQITPAMAAQMAGVAAAPPMPAQPSPLTKADVAATVAETLIALGLVKSPGDAKTVATPPAQAVPPTAQGKMEKMFGAVIETAMEQFIGGVQKSIKQTMTGIGSPPPEEEEPEPEAPPEPPDDGKPWKSIKIADAKWSNGSQIVYTPDKDSDSIFTKDAATGFLLENPIFAEKGIEMIQNLSQAAAEALKRVAAPSAAGVAGQPPRQIPPLYVPPQPQVVDATPPGAQDATPKPGWKEG
jgi:hypothetical protein